MKKLALRKEEKNQMNEDRIPADVAAFLASGGEITKIMQGATSYDGGNPSDPKYNKSLKGKLV